jgi:FtsH-binding integral membrane protein
MIFNKQNILNKVKEAQQSTVVMDEGLRAYMLKVYNYMASGILLTGLVSLIFFKLSVVTDANGSIVALTSLKLIRWQHLLLKQLFGFLLH